MHGVYVLMWFNENIEKYEPDLSSRRPLALLAARSALSLIMHAYMTIGLSASFTKSGSELA